jgi:hypothetical protein
MMLQPEIPPLARHFTVLPAFSLKAKLGELVINEIII